MPETTIYFDVDGVFNACSVEAPSEDETGWTTWNRKKINGYWIMWSPELVDEVNRLTALPGVTAKWLTTWAELAPEMIAPELEIIGANTWDVVASRKQVRYYMNDWWKFKPLQADVEATQADRFVWVDDDLFYNRTLVYPFLDSHGDRVLAISPKIEFGITRAHIEDIEKFISK